MNYLKIPNDELRNLEEDRRETKWLKDTSQPVIHALSYM